jgi:hypothetical protein
MAKSARGLAIQIVMSEHSHSTISGIAQVLQTSRGACPVFLEVCDPGGNKARLRAGQEFSINPTSVDVARLEDILGKGRVKLVW